MNYNLIPGDYSTTELKDNQVRIETKIIVKPTGFNHYLKTMA